MGLMGWVQAASAIGAGALVAGLWQSVLLAAMVWICLALAPKLSGNVRFLVWAAVFLAILALPFASLVMAHFGSADRLLATGTSGPIFRLDVRWAIGLAAFWLTMSLVRIAGLVRNALRVRSLLKAAKPIDAGARLRPLLDDVGTRGPVQLCTSGVIDQPCVIGFFVPRILVPEWLLESATSSELEQVVRHELAHLRRFDDWTNLFQKLALVVFPLNPGLVWVERRLCAEREAASDESVVRATKAPREYALCLANLASQRMNRRLAQSRNVALSLGAWEKRSELAGRIYGILRIAESLNPAKARALMAALLLAIAGGSVKLSSSTQLVSFAPGWDLAAEQQSPAISSQEAAMPKLRYRDVVFREPVRTKSSLVRPAMATHQVAKKKKAISSKPAPVRATPVLRQIGAPLDRIQSVIILSRWDASSDRPATMVFINQFFRTSAPSAAQEQSGWFVVQL
jgi:beta-lactamase regulating signal transducer with metallopeptidase domain